MVEIPPMPTVLSNNGWRLARTIDVPGSATTHTDADWLDSQSTVDAKAAGVVDIPSSRGEMGEIAKLAIMCTVFDASGQRVSGAALSASLVASIQVLELANAGFDVHSAQGRIVLHETNTAMATAGMAASAFTAGPIPSGKYALRLEGVTGMPATAGKRITIHAKLV